MLKERKINKQGENFPILGYSYYNYANSLKTSKPVLSVLFSILFIRFYNLENDLLYADEIFLYMSIPGFDLIRVSFVRLSKGLNMFSGDKKDKKTDDEKK